MLSVRSILIPVVIPAAVIGLAGCAGQQTTQIRTPDSVATQISGGDLDDVRAVWYQLGADRPGRRPAAFATTGRPAAYSQGPFSAQVFRVDLDGVTGGVSGGSDAIVRVGDAASWDWQLLAFLDEPTGWRYAGHVDLPNHRLGAPVPTTRTLGPGRSWVVVDTFRQATNTVTEQETAWYQIRAGRLVEVARMPARGHRVTSDMPFHAAYTAEILDVFLTPENQPAVTVSVEAVYTNARQDAYPGLGELFRRTGVVRYVQSTPSGEFRLDPRGSEWSSEELTGLLTESADQFVHNNRVQLVDLAHSGNETKRQWVSRLRQDCASPEIQRELTSLVTVESDR